MKMPDLPQADDADMSTVFSVALGVLFATDPDMRALLNALEPVAARASSHHIEPTEFAGCRAYCSSCHRRWLAKFSSVSQVGRLPTPCQVCPVLRSINFGAFQPPPRLRP